MPAQPSVAGRSGARPELPDAPPDASETTFAAPPGLPVEQRGHLRWLQACARTLAHTLVHPSDSFRRCPEPIAHGRVLGYLATLRLPPWAVLVAILGTQQILRDGPAPMPLRSIHSLLDPALTQALSAWLVLMIPVGLPLMYFVGGLLAHVGIALTGGAPRSIGATMRAIGYALAPALLATAIADLPLYLWHLPGIAYLGFVGALTFSFLVVAGIALARTHQISVPRGFLVALMPALLLAATTSARAALVLDDLPGLPPPDSPYYIP